MVVASLNPVHGDHFRSLAIPVIDLSCRRALVSELIVRACEEFGFFKVISHGVPVDVVLQMEAAALEFFSLPVVEKQRAGPSNPLGYGSKAIGMNGDFGEVEYLLLHTNSSSISQQAGMISRKSPNDFSCVVDGYVETMRELACKILELLAEGLGLKDSGVFSSLIRDRENDSLLRLNHYPPWDNKEDMRSDRIGFGEHSDPQIITLLRSNDVGGLQILSPSSLDGAVWVPVPPDPNTFYIMVGDLLQVMTNGRLVSVRHRAMVDSYSSRLSMAYFGAPPLHGWISPLPEMITPQTPRCYKSFTWAEYKKAMYSLRLGHNRLDLFHADAMEEHPGVISKREEHALTRISIKIYHVVCFLDGVQWKEDAPVSFLQNASIILFLRALMKRENDGTTAAFEEFSEFNQRTAQRHATKRQTGAPKWLQQRATALATATATATTTIRNG